MKRRGVALLWECNSLTFCASFTQIGSEDGLSVTTDMENHYNHFTASSNSAQQTHNNGNGGTNNTTSVVSHDDRIVFLEKELTHWRAQYELLKIETSSHMRKAPPAKSDQKEDPFSSSTTDRSNRLPLAFSFDSPCVLIVCDIL